MDSNVNIKEMKTSFSENKIKELVLSNGQVFISSEKCKDVVATPGSGTVVSGTTVTLTSPDSATIIYTTDGSVPSIGNGTVYTSAITITDDATIKTIAVKEAMFDSDVVVYDYVVS